MNIGRLTWLWLVVFLGMLAIVILALAIGDMSVIGL